MKSEGLKEIADLLRAMLKAQERSPDHPGRRLLTIQQAARYVSLSPDEIRERIARQTIPFLNISKGLRPVYRFDRQELDEWINSLPGLRAEDI